MNLLARFGRWSKGVILRMGRGAAVAAVVGIAMSLCAYYYLDRELEDESERALFLKKEIVKLDREIDEIGNLKDVIAVVLARKQVIEALHANRFMAVELFEQLARQRPKGTYLTLVQTKGLRVHIAGLAASHRDVAAFVTNLDSSFVVERPQLIEVRGETGSQPSYPVRFNVEVWIRRSALKSDTRAEKGMPRAAR